MATRITPAESTPDLYKRLPRTLEEAFGPYAKLEDDHAHRDLRAEKRCAIISMVVIVLFAALIIAKKLLT